MRISSMPKCRCKTIEKISPHQPPSYQSLAKISSIVSPSGKSFFENLIIKKRAAMGPNISRRTKRKTPLLVYLPPPLSKVPVRKSFVFSVQFAKMPFFTL